jgi:glycosyltransferase involved in cell wall biosynthesis
MPDHLQADVIVPVYRDTAMTIRCLESVLAHGDETLRTLIVVDDLSPEPDMRTALEQLSGRDPRLQLTRNDVNLGFVGSCNRGLSARRGDAVLLNSDTIVTSGWLRELAEVAHIEVRTSCVSPLSNHASICSVPEFCEETPFYRVDGESVLSACADLPRWTDVPTGVGFCLYLPGRVLDLVGPLDLAFAPGYNEENDWAMRAQAMGFVARRANHAFVYHLGSRSFLKKTRELERRNARLLYARHPNYSAQVRRFFYTLESRMAGHAVRVESSGRLRVALDLRHIPAEPVVAATYATALGRAFWRLPGVELTLVVREARQAAGIDARVTMQQDLLEDVEVIHKPAPVLDPTELKLLFASPVHTIITHLDMMSSCGQDRFGDQTRFTPHPLTSSLLMQATQKTLAISEFARREILDGVGLSPDEVVAIPLGVDHQSNLRCTTGESSLSSDLVPSRDFFLTVSSGFPHSNLGNLIKSYQILRSCWSRPELPPELVVVDAGGEESELLYDALRANTPPGITFLPAIPTAELRALYQSAMAFVFPSVYECSGLPILESMAAGTPVIAQPLAAVPEVGGDAILYTNGTSPEHLAQAMELLATDADLREDLRARGLRRSAEFTWERTARLTLEAYRAAIFRPSERSLRARRQLAEMIQTWPAAFSSPPASDGILNACNSLKHAVRLRVHREFKRFKPNQGRRSA